MSAQEEWKRNAAGGAAKLVEDEMSVGLGSGSTLAEVVKVLGENGSEAEFVVSSTSTRRLAEEKGLSLTSLRRNSELDLAIDGADEVDPNLDMIKGGGGAHTREKIVASAAKEVIAVVDRTKLVKTLGEKNPVPTEVIPFAREYTAGLLEEFGGEVKLRESTTSGPFVTDNGNNILDLHLQRVIEPSKLEAELNRIPGVVENGIFADVADRIFVGHEGGYESIVSKEEFQEISHGFDPSA